MVSHSRGAMGRITLTSVAGRGQILITPPSDERCAFPPPSPAATEVTHPLTTPTPVPIGRYKPAQLSRIIDSHKPPSGGQATGWVAPPVVISVHQSEHTFSFQTEDTRLASGWPRHPARDGRAQYTIPAR